MRRTYNNSIEQDFKLFYKIATASGDEEAWKKALSEVRSASGDTTINSAIEKIYSAALTLDTVLDTLESLNIDQNQIVQAIKAAIGIGAVRTAKFDMKKMKKFAMAYDQSSPAKRQQLIKQAGILDYVTNAISGFGEKAFTIIRAVKGIYDVYNGLSSLKSAWSIAEGVGLKWYEVFLPGSLEAKLADPSISDDPEKISVLGKLAANAKEVIKKAFSVLSNLLSGPGSQVLTIILKVITESVGLGGEILGNLSSMTPIINWVMQTFATPSVISYLTSGYDAVYNNVISKIKSHITEEVEDSPGLVESIFGKNILGPG